MDGLAVSLLFSAGLIAILRVGFRALLIHAVDLRAHHPERYSGAWRALGDLAPSRVEPLRTTIIVTLVALAIVVVLAVTGAMNGLVRSPTALLLAVAGLAIVTVSGSAAALFLLRRGGPPAQR